MRLRRSDILSLTSVLAVLWSLAQGRPGPACNAEWPNAQDITGHLKNCLEHLHKLFLEEGYKDGEKRSRVCLPTSKASDGATQLDMISTQLCQYNACLMHLENSFWGTNQLPLSITSRMSLCQRQLSHLRNTISKMRPTAALYPSFCEVAWPFAGTGWREITTGPQLSKELLEYLKQLQFPCG
ncbi:unnamed protein product [Natator depressus]